eukprot:scaffold22272_cov16-Prasinocladus_malaysianus.AAC.1
MRIACPDECVEETDCSHIVDQFLAAKSQTRDCSYACQFQMGEQPKFSGHASICQCISWHGLFSKHAWLGDACNKWNPNQGNSHPVAKLAADNCKKKPEISAHYATE